MSVDFALMSLNDNECVVGTGKSQWEKTPSVRGSFYFPDFFLKNKTPFLTFPHLKKISFKNIRLKKKELDIPFEDPSQSLFFNMIQAFRNSLLQKAVPYTFATSKIKGSRALFFYFLKNLIERAKQLPVFPYAFWVNGEAFLGATPESLFRKRGRSLETVALAGTSFLGKSFTPKDYREHQFVVDGIKSSLEPFGEVSFGKTSTLDLKTLCHLKTPIAVNLKKEVTLSELVYALHPTGALGTYPKEDLSLQNPSLLTHYEELLPRGRFGAPVGFVLGDVVDLFVAIRNIQFDETGMRIGAGCGVISDSLEEEEWLEVCAKLRATKSWLGL